MREEFWVSFSWVDEEFLNRDCLLDDSHIEQEWQLQLSFNYATCRRFFWRVSEWCLSILKIQNIYISPETQPTFGSHCFDFCHQGLTSLVLEFHINKIISRFLFFSGLVLFIIMFLRFIHIVCIVSSFFLNSWVVSHYIQYIHSL